MTPLISLSPNYRPVQLASNIQNLDKENSRYRQVALGLPCYAYPIFSREEYETKQKQQGQENKNSLKPSLSFCSSSASSCASSSFSASILPMAALPVPVAASNTISQQQSTQFEVCLNDIEISIDNESAWEKLRILLRKNQCFIRNNVSICNQKITDNDIKFICKAFNPLVSSNHIMNVRIEVARLVFNKLYEEGSEFNIRMIDLIMLPYMQFEFLHGDPLIVQNLILKLLQSSTLTISVIEFSMKFFLSINDQTNSLTVINKILSSAKMNLEIIELAILACEKIKKIDLVSTIILKAVEILSKEAKVRINLLFARHLLSFKQFPKALEILNESFSYASLPLMKDANINPMPILLLRRLVSYFGQEASSKERIRESLIKYVGISTNAHKMINILQHWNSVELAVGDIEYSNFLIQKIENILSTNAPKHSNDKKNKEILHGYLHYILAIMAYGDTERALKISHEAYNLFPLNSRICELWLQGRCNEQNDEVYFEHLNRILQKIPKSGNLWLSSAQLHMNPLSMHFDLQKAELCLLKALKYTPQLGDVSIEFLRLSFIRKRFFNKYNQMSSIANADVNINLLSNALSHLKESSIYGLLWTRVASSFSEKSINREILHHACVQIESQCEKHKNLYQSAMLGKFDQLVPEIFQVERDKCYRDLSTALGSPLQIIVDLVKMKKQTTHQQLKVASFFVQGNDFL